MQIQDNQMHSWYILFKGKKKEFLSKIFLKISFITFIEYAGYLVFFNMGFFEFDLIFDHNPLQSNDIPFFTYPTSLEEKSWTTQYPL